MPPKKVIFNANSVFISGMECSKVDLSLNVILNPQRYEQFLKKELPQLLMDVHLARPLRIYFEHNDAPVHFLQMAVAHLNQHYPSRYTV